MTAEQRLLIIDDDAHFTAVLQRALQRRGFQVTVANDGATALALAAQEQPQKAVLDLKIDHESGLRLLPELKQLLPELQVVMLTGYSSVATAVEAIKLGATNYLCKPADADAILAAFAEQQGNPDTQIAEHPPSVNRLEWEHIQRVLAENDGNISATARALGMHRRTLQRKLQKFPVRR